MIVDLSSPWERSVNDGIDPNACSLAYASLDNAVELVTVLGLVKMDLMDAYRIVPVHPDDHHLLAISWEGSLFVDRCLPFGLRSAPKIFTAFADALASALYCHGIRYVMHYLDDFLFIGTPDSHEAARTAELASATFDHLGVPVTTNKTEGPSTCVTFLGIIVDTATLQLRLPGSKLQRLQSLLQNWQDKRSCTRKDLERLLGHLSHAATIIRPGRIFLRHLFSLLSSVKQPNHFIRLNRQVRADLRWWQYFLQSWNGVSLLPTGEASVHVFSDASGSFGCGAFTLNSGWFQLQWPQSWADIDISSKEMVPVVVCGVAPGPYCLSH